MTTAFNDFGCDVFFSADEGVGAEIGDTGFGVDNWKRGRSGTITSNDHGGDSAGVRLFREVEVRQHYVARLMEKDI